jgi:hypothetical protein
MNVPALSINKVCLSGIDAIALADQLIRAGEFEIIVAGGQESMTNAPHLLEKSRDGFKYGNVTLRDHMDYDALSDVFTAQGMGGLTESANHGERAVTREEQDEFAARSHQLAARAWKDGSSTTRSSPCRSRSARATRSSSGRRGHPRRHHRPVARRPAPGLRQGRHHHRRLRLPDLRRGLPRSSSCASPRPRSWA